MTREEREYSKWVPRAVRKNYLLIFSCTSTETMLG
jgi:hypothetical protein